MIIAESKLKVADNSGALVVKCIHVNGSTGLYVANVGDMIMVSIRANTPTSKVKKGDVHRAVIVRTRKLIERKDGTSLSFMDNAVVLIDKNMEPIGTRVLGPIAREVRNVSVKIISLAQEVF